MTSKEFHNYLMTKCEEKWNTEEKEKSGLWCNQDDDTKSEYYNKLRSIEIKGEPELDEDLMSDVKNLMVQVKAQYEGLCNSVEHGYAEDFLEELEQAVHDFRKVVAPWTLGEED